MDLFNMAEENKFIFLVMLRQRLQLGDEETKTRRNRTMWTRQIFLERETKGEFHTLVQEAKLADHEYFYKMFRMTPATFEKLLTWVAPHITKKDTQMRAAISPEERLCVTLRYLATGDAQVTIGASYRISPSSVSGIIQETTRVIWDVLVLNGYMTAPSTKQEWKEIATNFELQWDFPNCLGAIDGKHITIQAPAKTGSEYFNYKKNFSIVLMAVCDANYKFTMVDVGDSGRQSDGGVFANSELGYAINNKLLNFPEANRVPNTPEKFPYVFVGDEAFALKDNLLKPYASATLNQERRIFNYRLSRARRTIENSFGILSSKFRIFRRAIIAETDTVTAITKAAVALHNFLLTEKGERGNFSCQREDWRSVVKNDSCLESISQVGSNNYTRDAKGIRDQFCNYFNSPAGSVSWQMDMI